MTSTIIHQGITEQVKNMIRHDVDMFERVILAAMLLDIKRSRTYMDVIGTLSDKSQTEDFENQWHWVIYQSILHYYRYVCAGGVPKDQPPLNISLFRQCVEEIAKSGQSMPMSMVPDLIGYMELQIGTLYQSPAASLGVADVGFVHWLTERRRKTILARADREMWETSTVLETLKREGAYLTNIGRVEEDMFAFGHGIDNPRPYAPRLRVSITYLNQLLGGGFGRTEGTLLIAPNGAGKTVLTTQLASEFCMGGAYGLIITTEQSHHLLEARIISSLCRIPFEGIKDGVKGESLMKFTSDQRERYENVRGVLANRLLIYDWPAGTARSVETGLGDDILRAAERLGKLDFFALDWLGGALAGRASSAEEKRMMISAGSNATVQYAKEYNVIGLVAAQATASLSINKPRIDQTCIADCKSASDNHTNIIGASLMYDKEDPTSTRPSREQILSVPKSRMGETGSVRVYRDFGYQRFGNIAQEDRAQ